MAMHLVIPIPTLIHHRQLEQGPHVRTIARERDEHRDVHRIVLGVFTVGVKVNRPVVTAHRERVAHYVFTHAHPFRQRVTLHRETVRSVHRLADEAGRRAIVGAGLGIRHGFARFGDSRRLAVHRRVIRRMNWGQFGNFRRRNWTECREIRVLPWRRGGAVRVGDVNEKKKVCGCERELGKVSEGPFYI